MKKIFFTRDVILVGIIFLIGILILCGLLIFGKTGKSVQVRIDGKVTAQYPLSENRTEIIQGINGKNTLVIENGEAFILDADCLDALCVKTGRISMAGQTIICLPHKTVIEICDSDIKQNSGEDIDVLVK